MLRIGEKIPCSLAEYAKRNGMGLGSFRLKDGSSLKLLSKSPAGDGEVVTNALRVKNGKLLGSERIVGTEGMACAAEKFEKLAENPADVQEAWMHSLDVIV